MTAGPAGDTDHDPLTEILADRTGAFALLHRPESAGRHVVEVLTGTARAHAVLADLPVPPEEPPESGRAEHDLLTVIPFRQVAERGFPCHDDGMPLLSLAVASQRTYPVSEVLERIPDLPVRHGEVHAVPCDEEYEDLVRLVIAEEIGRGAGSNFVIKRDFVTQLEGLPAQAARTLFRRLLTRETGAYWTFLVHTGDRTLVGACPERHLSLSDETAVMNPVSGTYRYPATGPSVEDALVFLADRKEADELYMVVDEELKMMARLCEGGGRVMGPYLKEMGHLAHSEYYIEGRTRQDPRTMLHETLFAPTVTGSPLESACHVIARREPTGRGYYSGVVALIGRDGRGRRRMDSSILIRTADVDSSGELSIGVGATIVRHSDPAAECAETHAKAAGLLRALDEPGRQQLSEAPAVQAALAARNNGLSSFWIGRDRRADPPPVTAGGAASVLMVDAEDTFTAMLTHQFAHLGYAVTVRRHEEDLPVDEHDLVVMGPGPGDPRATDHPKMRRLRGTIRHLLDERRPFLAVCLSHQILADELGLPLLRRRVPHQGVRREIDLFGERRRVGFYNTFEARKPTGKLSHRGHPVHVSADPETGGVHALRGAGFASVQFHPESLLTEEGPAVLAGLVASLEREHAVV
ncbi:anthranilate synthase family protein [Streptomyces sp. NPDC001904]|uniref:anthranilate synthase family protein n=1 Tax=Streptomyces sp. NPDC001904 TaxID=3154531 RepID=UPI003332DC85